MTEITRREFLRRAALLTATVSLAACQPNRATPTLSTKATSALDEVEVVGQPTMVLSPTRAAPIATAQPIAPALPEELPVLATIVAHRLQFGARPGDEETFNALGSDDEARLQAWLDAQLDPSSLEDSAFDTRFQAARFETLHKSLEELAYDHIVNNPYDDSDDRHWQWYVQPVEELVEATFLRAVYSRRQLQEVLADFWHNHFNVYGWQDDVTPLFVSYDRDVIRAHALGNFREFLEAVARHPAMLFYLDNRSNSDAGPNENFARELFELYTLGAENYLGVRDPNSVERDAQGLAVGYVDNDVYEAARCFTGWRVDDDLWDGDDEVGDTLTFRYMPAWHDRYNKLVLGRYIPADQADMQDGRNVLDLLAHHPGTAHFVAGKLCRRLVSDTPSESLVQHAAQVFLENADAPDQLARVVRAILTTAEFRQTWRAKIKRPFEVAAAALRALDASFDRLPGGARWTFEMMGQPLFGRRPPDGYADSAEAWSNTMTTLYGWNLITGLVNNWWSEEEDGGRVSTDVWASTPVALDSAEAVVDTWLARLQIPAFPADSRQAVIEFLSAGDSPESLAERLPGAVGLILMSPEFRYR